MKLKVIFIPIIISVFSFNIYAQLPKMFTPIHELYLNTDDFHKDNPWYKKDGSFLIRKKPKNVSHSWNYDLIVANSGEHNKIDQYLFRVYKYTTKEHLKDKTILKKYLKNQFNVSRYAIKDKETKEDLLHRFYRSDIIKIFVDKNFDSARSIIELIAKDNTNTFIFFRYKGHHYIFLGALRSLPLAEIPETDTELIPDETTDEIITIDETTYEYTDSTRDTVTTDETTDTPSDTTSDVPTDATSDVPTDVTSDVPVDATSDELLTPEEIDALLDAVSDDNTIDITDLTTD